MKSITLESNSSVTSGTYSVALFLFDVGRVPSRATLGKPLSYSVSSSA